MMSNVYDILQERGFIAQVTDEEAVRKILGEEQITFTLATTARPTVFTPGIWSPLWL